MLCPVCKEHELIHKNNSYFCPKCKLYASSVGDGREDKTEERTATPTTDFFSDQPAGSGQLPFKNYLLTLGASLFLIIIYFVLTNLNSYIDIKHFCLIRIENSQTQGNRQSIMEAINLIKQSDPANYKTLCQNIDTIAEVNCQNAEPHLNPNEASLATIEGGCFVKGSKTIYLTPVKSYSGALVKTRLETLKRNVQFTRVINPL